MDNTFKRPSKVRVANFTDIPLPLQPILNFDSENVHAIVKKVREYADLPYVYVVAKEKLEQVSELLTELRAMRSPCYPYALFMVDDADLAADEPGLDVVKVASAEEGKILERVAEYVSNRFKFDERKLQFNNTAQLPAKVDVAIVGAGITGLYAASKVKESGLSFCILEKSGAVGGIWRAYANLTSQVNTSECAYRLFEKTGRSNRDHSDTREILEDIADLSEQLSDRLFTGAEVERIAAGSDGYQILLNAEGKPFTLESKGVILAINDRVGRPREVKWENQSLFQGKIVSGASNDTENIDWRRKNVVIVGMGAFAVENARTALEGGARHVTVVCRRHGTVCPKIIDYLNFATPYDDDFRHDKKSNLRNMMYWKKLYELSGATQPECWMAKIKHEGHTISVSDIWFVAHYLKKIETTTGSISSMTKTGVIVEGGDGQHHIEADIVVNCVGFERNTSAAKALTGFDKMYNNNYLAKDFVYLADAFIDGDAFNSLFGSSVLEMVKFYVEVFIKFFNDPEFERMITMEGIEKIPIEDRKWSHYIEAAMALIRNYPSIQEVANRQITQRTNNFLEAHDLETYIAANKREWIDTHSLLTGNPMQEEDCLPYVFERLITK